MKRYVILLIGVLGISVSCNKVVSPPEEAIEPALILSPIIGYYDSGIVPEGPVHLKRAAVPQTIKFFELSGTIDFDFTACTPNIGVLIQGEGNASHLGRYSVLNTYCSDGVNPVSPIYGFLTAANGDEIHTQLIGAGYDPDLGMFYNYIILEGTGRFEGVSGDIIMHGTMDLENLEWTLQGEGTIYY